MATMNEEQLRKFLKEKGCTIELDLRDGIIHFELPERHIAPFADAMRARINTSPEGISIDTDDDIQPGRLVRLPQYAIKAFVLAIIVTACEKHGYNKELIFYNNEGKSTDPLTFLHHMLSFPLSPEDTEKDEALRTLVTKAATCPIKFHSDFDTRAVNLGIADGYKRVKHILLGGHVYS